jgi:hypothetical protein
MKQLRILEANEIGHGILIETDAGWVSPKDERNMSVLKEATNLDYRNPFEFYAVLQKYDTPNRNGRFYPERILKREAENYKKTIAKGLSTSELNHPESSLIDLDRVSHIITELSWDANYVNGKAKITETPMGEIVKGLLDSGWKGGVSTRGLGSLRESNGVMVVQPDFKLSTVDIVSDPSGPGCYVNGIMENAEWIYDPVKNTWHEEKLHEMKKQIRRMSMNELEQKQLSIFEDYIASLTVKDHLL